MEMNGVIERKLRLLEQKLGEIAEWEITNYSEFKKSSLKINAVERALTVCVEILIDVSERILALKKIPPKNSSVENFKCLEKIQTIKCQNLPVSIESDEPADKDSWQCRGVKLTHPPHHTGQSKPAQETQARAVHTFL